jgi:hypothetical protein
MDKLKDPAARLLLFGIAPMSPVQSRTILRYQQQTFNKMLHKMLQGVPQEGQTFITLEN